jgi:hypothetical protein
MKLTLMIISMTVTLAFIAARGRGKPAFYRDADGSVAPGSISEKIYVPIGGVDQGMIIRTRDINNPVLLFVHGGPGFPTYFLVEKYNPGLEEQFTVCYWEQRCGGLSWSADRTPESITLDRLAADAIEVTNYLRQRFEKEKIYILTVNTGLTKEYFDMLKAPDKRFYLFENSAHSPLFDEPERFRKVERGLRPAQGTGHRAQGVGQMGQ